ncbi:MAG TPA: glycosyltransferase family 4 protein [Gaiellaceae bacterium]|nr:glycosyltransferase family 4 protein [Gaiellaceae bacterium]
MRVPWQVRAPVRRARNAFAAARATLRQLPRWRAIAATPPRRDEVAVSYGVERMPSPDDVVYGGAVKFTLLHARLPNAARDFNVLYLGSSSLPIDARALVALARRRRAVFAWNQNGVAYPGWYGEGWQLVNRPRARLLREADVVFYQSRFCKLSADRFYGEPTGRWEVLPNPVDTERFVPAPAPERPLTLLLGGSQYQRYRVEVALETLARVRLELKDARLIVAGALTFAPDAGAVVVRQVQRLGLGDAVQLAGPYTQAQAPALLQQADVLLHTKYNDPCPTAVLEAMACGLPVVYSASGGVPELVGDAGVGVEAPLDWERDHPPDPGDLARAVLQAHARLPELRVTARARAVERFDAAAWIARHVEVFGELTGA